MANGKIKGITIELDGNTTGLTNALKDADKQAKELEKELKEVDKALRLDPTNVDLMAQRQQILAQSVAATSERLDVLRQAQAQVEAQFERGDIGADQYRAFQRELAMTESSLASLSNEVTSSAQNQQRLIQSTRDFNTLLGATGTSLEDYNDLLGTRMVTAIRNGTATVDQMNRAIRQVGQVATGTTTDIDELRQVLRNVDNGSSLSDVRQDLAAIGTEAAQAENKVEKLSGSMKELGGAVGVGAAAGVAGMFGLTEATEETVKAMARLKTGAAESGNSMGTAEEAVKRLSSVTGDTRAAVEAVNNLMASGYKDADLLTMIDNVTGAYVKFSDTLSGEGISDGIQETVALKEAAGSYLELLERHGVDVEEFNKKLQAQSSDADAAKFAMDQFTKLGLAPMAEEYKKLNPELAANEEATANLEQAMADFSVVIMPIVAQIKQLVADIMEWATQNKDLALTIGAILTAVAGIAGSLAILSPIISGVLTTLKLLGTAISLIVSPMGLVVAAIAALVAAFIYAYRESETFRAGVDSVFNSIREVVVAVMQEVASFVGEKIAEIKKFWDENGEQILQAVENVWNFIKGVFETVMPIIAAIVKDTWESIKEIIDGAIDIITGAIQAFSGLLTGDFESMWEGIKTMFDGAVQFIWNLIELWIVGKVLKGFKLFGEKAFEFVKDMVDKVKGKFDEFVSAAKTKFTAAKDAALKPIKALYENVKSTFTNMLTSVTTTMNNVKTTISDLWEKAKSAIKPDSLLQVGKDVINGLIQGIGEMFGSVKKKITSLGELIPEWAKKALGIHSPARTMIPVGVDTIRGVEVGMESRHKIVEGILKDITNGLLDVTDHYLQEEEKIIENANTEIAKIEKKSAEDIDKIQRAAYEKKRKMTKDENIKIERIQQSAADNIAKIQKKSIEDSVKLLDKEQKDKLEYIKSFISDKKSLDQMNLVDEALIWEKSIALFQEGSKERIEAQKSYQKSVEAVNKEIVSINSEYQSKIKAIDDKLVKDVEDATKAYTDAVEKRSQALSSFAGTFDAFSAELNRTGLELMTNLQSQVDGFKHWQFEFEKLSGRGVNKELLNELSELGVKALPELVALNSLTDEQLTQYSALYQEKGQLAREQAEKELAGMKADTEVKITEMRKMANSELSKLHNEWMTKIKGVTEGTKAELSSLKQIGVNAGNGLLEGLASTASSLYEKAREIANNISNIIDSALNGNSASVARMEFDVHSNEGLIKAMEQPSSLLQRTMNKANGSLAYNAGNPVSAQSAVTHTLPSSTTTTTENHYHMNFTSPRALDPYEAARLSRNALKEVGLRI